MRTALIKIFFGTLLPILSPALRDMLHSALRAWFTSALETDTPLDDAIAKIFCDVLGVDVSDLLD
jgi:hypothetical protein